MRFDDGVRLLAAWSEPGFFLAAGVLEKKLSSDFWPDAIAVLLATQRRADLF